MKMDNEQFEVYSKKLMKKMGINEDELY